MTKTERFPMVLFFIGLLLIGCQAIAEERWYGTPSVTESSMHPPMITVTSTKEPPTQTVPATPMPTYTITSPEGELTSVIGPILSDPDEYVGQEVTILGYYRGWDLLGEAGTGPPTTESDWVIVDASGAIYVAAGKPVEGGLQLDPYSPQHCWNIVRVVGVVSINPDGQVYIEPKRIELVVR